MSTSDQSKDSGKPTQIDLPEGDDVEEIMRDHPVHSQSPDELRLERFDNRPDDMEEIMDDDDDEDDDHDHISQHPLFGMLTGRLGQPRRRGSTHKYDSLHPVTSVLSVANVDDCLELEKSFPESERASREKLEYRLSRCPELCFGILSQPTKVEAEKAGQPSKRNLVAMIVATRTPAPAVTDASMDIPNDWKTNKATIPPSDGSEALGHQDLGGTIALHGLVVAPEHRNKGLATVLLKSYIQRIKDSKIADRVALLAHDNMTSFYSSFGFEDMGPSSCKHAGGGWHNMVLAFSDVEED